MPRIADCFSVSTRGDGYRGKLEFVVHNVQSMLLFTGLLDGCD